MMMMSLAVSVLYTDLYCCHVSGCLSLAWLCLYTTPWSLLLSCFRLSVTGLAVSHTVQPDHYCCHVSGCLSLAWLCHILNTLITIAVMFQLVCHWPGCVTYWTPWSLLLSCFRLSVTGLAVSHTVQPDHYCCHVLACLSLAWLCLILYTLITIAVTFQAVCHWPGCVTYCTPWSRLLSCFRLSVNALALSHNVHPDHDCCHVSGCLSLAWLCHILYTLAQFYPAWETLVPASILLGAMTGPTWTAQGMSTQDGSVIIELLIESWHYPQ